MAATVVTLLAVACGGDAPAPRAVDTPAPSATVTEPATTSTTAARGTSTTATTAPPVPDLAAVRAVLTPVATLERPTALRPHPRSGTLYVSERQGRLVTLDGAVALDFSERVGDGGEGGFLGFAFSPDGERLYVSYTTPDLDSRIDEYRLDGERVDTASRREVLAVDQPFPNHKGGDLHFGPDGLLWYGLGDGGGAGDPSGNGQDLGTLLGKLLRIDPRAAGDDPYAIPSTNPFLGHDDARPEIWAYGLRNPWRFSFDRATGDLWVADVGQGDREEVDWLAAGTGAGTNFGWDRLEGTQPFEGSPPEGAVPPVFEYTHAEGCSVTGGVVYRGSAVPALVGAYLFGDYCTSRVRALVGRDGRVVDERDLDLPVPDGNLVSFGEDADGEVYVLSLAGTVYRLDGA